MKIGIRKPNLKKSLKARTTGKLKRAVKKSVNPLYGKKGVGLITNPKKAIYNKVYDKTTIGISDIAKSKTTGTKNDHTNIDTSNVFLFGSSALGYKILSILFRIFAILIIIFSLLLMIVLLPVGIIFLLLGIFFYVIGNKFKNKSQLVEQELDEETITENM